MAIITSSKVLKFIKYTSLLWVSLYAIHPFINGVGCDFQLQASDDTIDRYMTCSHGMIKAVEKHKQSGRYITYNGVYGRSGDNVVIFVYRVTDFNSQPFESFQPGHFLKSRHIHVAKHIPAADRDWVLARAPIYQIYSAKRIGKLGWW